MSSSPCAACKFLRRKCTPECVFSAYFPADNPRRFSDVHKVFGASNVAKILQDMEPAHREDAVESLAYEAGARIIDPVYGCVGTISQMQQKVSNLQASLQESKKQLASMVGPANMYQMLQDSMMRAHYTPILASASPSSALLGMDHHQHYKFQQEQYQKQQQQIGAHIMQQMLQQSERQQQLVQQAGAGGGQLVIRERQQLSQEQQLHIQMKDEQHKKQVHGHGGAMVIRDTTGNLRKIDTQEAATLQAREEQDMFTMSYEEIHRQAQMVVLRQQHEAELMSLHQHIEARGGAGPSRTTADLSPLLAQDGGFHSMNLYPVQQQQQQQSLSMLQQPQHQPEELLLQQEQQQEIQDIQLFPDHNLHPLDP